MKLFYCAVQSNAPYHSLPTIQIKIDGHASLNSWYYI